MRPFGRGWAKTTGKPKKRPGPKRPGPDRKKRH